MYQVGKDQFGDEGGYDIAQEDGRFWSGWADQIEGGRENDYVEDIVNDTCEEYCKLGDSSTRNWSTKRSLDDGDSTEEPEGNAYAWLGATENRG